MGKLMGVPVMRYTHIDPFIFIQENIKNAQLKADLGCLIAYIVVHAMPALCIAKTKSPAALKVDGDGIVLQHVNILLIVKGVFY